jgi:hypothetical protein
MPVPIVTVNQLGVNWRMISRNLARVSRNIFSPLPE